MTTLERLQAKHKAAADALCKCRDKRDQAIKGVIRAETRYHAAIKAMARAQRRLDAARKEETMAKRAGKKAALQSKQELPDIGAAIGV